MKIFGWLNVLLTFVILAPQPARAEIVINDVFYFDDSVYQAIAAPTPARWLPGHSGGICNSSGPMPGGLCGPGSFSDGSVWGYLAPPSPGAIIDTNVGNYGALTPVPFNDFLWVREWDLAPGLFGNYLYSQLVYESSSIFLQFNSAIPVGFDCGLGGTAPPGSTCGHTILEDGIMTAGYVRWSDGSFDKIMFYGEPIPIPEPETYAMLLAGLGVLGFFSRRRKPQAA
jgi:hypothetical protein